MTRSRDTANTQGNVGGSLPPFTAGKNAIINGDFRINQRAFSSTTTSGIYTFDRWNVVYSGGTCTYSTQAFTPGAAPVTGYESTNFLRTVSASQSATTHYAAFRQPIEDVRTFAGQTVTVSFWAKASTGTPSVAITLDQTFGSGGSSNNPKSGSNITISSSWARYSSTITLDSVSGKTIGTGSCLYAWLFTSCGSAVNSGVGYPVTLGVQNITVDVWGFQVEAGSVATPFTTATGTIQGELAACQRYYVRTTASANNAQTPFGYGYFYSSTGTVLIIRPPVTMRTTPSFTFSYCGLTNTSGGNMVLSGSPSNYYSTADVVQVTQNSATAQTTGQFTTLAGSNASSGTGYVELSAEL